MRGLYGIESGYLSAIRVAVAIAVVLGVLAVCAAILLYALVHTAAGGAREPSEYFQAPDWASVRHRVLPGLAEQRTSTDSPPGQNETPHSVRRPVDERIVKIAANLNAQFARSPGSETGFTDRYPRRLLEAWVFEESAMPQAHLASYVRQLIAVSEAIGEDPQINRIGSFDDRAQTIMRALDAFRVAFAARLEQAERLAADASAQAAVSRAEMLRRSLYLGIGGLGLLVSLALIVVLLRIEVHLRNQTASQTLAKAGGPHDDHSV